MIYVASPYSHVSPDVQRSRFEAVRSYTAMLIHSGLTAFSPIVYAHEMAAAEGFKTDAKSWEQFNIGMLRVSSAMYVLCLQDWEQSIGVKQEIGIASILLLPTSFVPGYEYEKLRR